MTLTRAAGALSRAGAAVGAVALAVMVALITAQVVSRRVMSTPMVIADELSGWLLVVATFSALGYALMNGDHIQVTLITDRLGAGVQRGLRILSAAIGVALTALLAWRTGQMAWDSFESGSFSVAGSGLPLWPVQAFVPAGFAILLLQMVAMLLNELAPAGTGPR